MKKILIYLIINLIIFNGCDVYLFKANIKPTSPVLTFPSNNATNIKLDAVLSWKASTDEDGDVLKLKYNVYFGVANPPKIVSALQTTLTYNPNLIENTTYYWKVTVNDGKGGESSSDVWSFNTFTNNPNPTNSPPSIPVLTSPLANASGVILNSNLEWQASTDPDGDVVKYYVVFSTNYPPDDTVSRLQTTTSYTPNLTQSTPYYWKIIATDEKGANSVSETISFTTATNTNVNSNPPSIPNLLNPSNGSANIPLNEVLRWNKSIDPEGDLVTYSVLFGTDATPTTSVSSAKSDTTFAPTLVYNTLYYWKIVASDASGLTNESEIRSFTTLDQNVTKITLNSPAHNSTKINLNEILKWNEWKPANGGTFKYTVYFGTESTPTRQVSITQTGNTFAPSLTASTSYYWKVIASDGSANTSESDVWKFTTASNPLPILTLTTPANQSTNIALNTSLNWNAVTDGTKTIKYNVYFGTATNPTKIVSTLQSTTTYTPAGLVRNTTYYWKIVADNGDGAQTESDIWSFTTLNSPPTKPALNTPADLSTNVSISEALTWTSSTDPEGDIVNYNVYLETTNPPTTKVTNSPLSSTSYNPTLNGNTKYYWKVTAEDGKGGVTESDVRSFTTGAEPVTIPILISPNNNALNIPLTPIPTLSWNASVGTNGGAVTYNVYFGTTNPPSKVTTTPQTTTTYTPTNNLLSNLTYYWKVEAIITNEGSFNSEIRQFKTEIVPPSKPTLTAPSNSAINISLTPSLSWSASISSSGYTVKYNVYLGTSSNPTTKVSTLQSGTTFTPTALLSNTTYYWKIEADDEKGGVITSVIRSFKTIIPPSVPSLTAPVNLATDISLSTNFTWTASTTPSSNDIKYKVLLDTSSSFSSTLKVESALQTGTSFTLTYLLSNTNYYWKVIAVDGNGLMTESEVRKFKSLLVPPSVPTLTTPTNGAIDISLTPSLSWSASTSSSGYVIKYNVYLGTSSNPTTKVSTLQSGTSFTPTALLSNTTYYWKIEADDEKGGVITSEIRSFKTIVPPSIPTLTSPINLATNISINTNLTWNVSTSSSSNDIKYKVLLDTSITFSSPLKVESTLQQGTSYTLAKLLSNTKYYWKIIAVDGNGLTAESEVRNFKSIIVPPSVPSLTAPVNGAIEVTLTPTLTWSVSTSSSGNVVKYNVYLGTEKTSITKVSNLQTGTSYISIALTKNTKYYWKIEADDGNGGLSSSVIDSFTVIIFDLVNVEGGTFTMTNEGISKSVTLTSYNISKYEITQAQWLKVMGSNPSSFTNCSECPVETISWSDIQTFLTTLNTKSGKSYRLPTEAEWEYAARGGKKSNGYTYSGSNNIDSVAWYSGNSGSKTHVVGTTKKANELGIFDMTGNVFEWCSDWFGSYKSGSETNPTGPNTGEFRVLRGGGWNYASEFCVVTKRYDFAPGFSYNYNGFRLVLP